MSPRITPPYYRRASPGSEAQRGNQAEPSGLSELKIWIQEPGKTHNEEKNQAKKINPKMTQVIELIDKDM